MEEFFLAALNVKDDELIYEIGKKIVKETHAGSKRSGNKLFTGDFEDQLVHFSQAIDDKLYQKSLSHFLEMASLEHTLELNDLLDAYDKIIQDGAPSAFYKRKIEILISHNRITEALHDFCDYLLREKQDPSLKAVFMLCDFYVAEGNYSRASSCLEQLILSNPNNYVCYLKLAEVEYKIGRNPKKAFASFEKAWELKKEGYSSNEEENDEYKMTENWTFNKLDRFYKVIHKYTHMTQRRNSREEIIKFVSVSLFCIILIYNFYSYFQLVIFLIFVINLIVNL